MTIFGLFIGVFIVRTAYGYRTYTMKLLYGHCTDIVRICYVQNSILFRTVYVHNIEFFVRQLSYNVSTNFDVVLTLCSRKIKKDFYNLTKNKTNKSSQKI